MDLYYIKDFLFYNEMDVFAYFQRKACDQIEIFFNRFILKNTKLQSSSL